jgi:signal transduction histidine kinase
VAISVADNGPGIPPERRQDALRRFGRLDPARHAEGHGLGLALVEATARLHAGHVELADARPGLIVRLVLPIAGSSLPALMGEFPLAGTLGLDRQGEPPCPDLASAQG